VSARILKAPVDLWELRDGDRAELVDVGGDTVRHVFESRSLTALKAASAAGRPLLVVGEPGIGKSQLARALATVTGRAYEAYALDTRTEPEELCYRFDAVRRLAQAQLEAVVRMGRSATGTADERQGRSLREELRAELAVERFVEPGPLWRAFDWASADKQTEQADLGPHQPSGNPTLGTVLLLDEIDKADASVPNALLEALGEGRFRVPGSTKPVVMREPRPLVIATANEEDTLPDAFVRRCLVLHLALPEADSALVVWLMKRAVDHFGEHAPDEALRRKAAERLVRDRGRARELQLSLPGQAEYLDLLRALRDWDKGRTSGAPEFSAKALLEELAEFLFSKHRELQRTPVEPRTSVEPE
jgi:MoxR-like ATPase